MEPKISPEQLIAQVKTCHSDLINSTGKSWKTELLERLMANSKSMQDAWKQIAKRSHQPTVENANKYVSMYGLCIEFIEIGSESRKTHPTPRDKAEKFRDIAKQAAWLAAAIDGTQLNRVANPYLKVEPGKSTPIMSTLLKQLSADAKVLATDSVVGPNLLKRPGASNSTRTYAIRRLAILFNTIYGGHLQRTLASFTEAILGEEVTIEQVNSALQHWNPVKFDGRGEYL